ncbi:MAG: hypothetical protein D6785_02360, partial [Planctomycetota bacterium]
SQKAKAPFLDVLPDELEKEWFPEISKIPKEKREAQKKRIQEAIDQAKFSLQVWQDKIPEKGTESGNESFQIEMRTSTYRPPWELALQTWIESMAPGPRTYSRISRRAAANPDFILAGRKREGWTLHIVLDTSGSMTWTFSRILGIIASFCEAAGVEQVHILQCDVEVTQDEWIYIQDLHHYSIEGLGGSDMSPAMYRLAENPEVEAVLVLTDGWIDYPEEPMPYQVVWGVVEDRDFSPPYGFVVPIYLEEDEED